MKLFIRKFIIELFEDDWPKPRIGIVEGFEYYLEKRGYEKIMMTNYDDSSISIYKGRCAAIYVIHRLNEEKKPLAIRISSQKSINRILEGIKRRISNVSESKKERAQNYPEVIYTMQ